MDVLVEFCRTGELGPLRLGITAAEVEQHLGSPDKVKRVHGESSWQRYDYGNLSLMLMSRLGEGPGKRDLRLSRITVDMHRPPPTLPPPILRRLTHDWTMETIGELLEVLRSNGIEPSLRHDSSQHGVRHQRFTSAGGASVIAFDGRLEKLRTE